MLVVVLRAERRLRHANVTRGGSGGSAMRGDDGVMTEKEKWPCQKVEREEGKLECEAIGWSLTDRGVQRRQSLSEPKERMAWFNGHVPNKHNQLEGLEEGHVMTCVKGGGIYQRGRSTTWFAVELEGNNGEAFCSSLSLSPPLTTKSAATDQIRMLPELIGHDGLGGERGRRRERGRGWHKERWRRIPFTGWPMGTSTLVVWWISYTYTLGCHIIKT